jgi:hypothetical protein
VLDPATQQQHNRRALYCIVDAIARAEINPQFIHALLQRFMIAKVSFSDPVYAPLDGNAASKVFEFIQLLLVRITTRGREIVADFHCLNCRLKAKYLQVAQTPCHPLSAAYSEDEDLSHVLLPRDLEMRILGTGKYRDPI